MHRLGRGTSGLMVLARSPLARSMLSRQFSRIYRPGQVIPRLYARFIKTYLALLGASDLPDRFTVTTPIGKVPHPTLGYVFGAATTGLSAISEAKVIPPFSNFHPCGSYHSHRTPPSNPHPHGIGRISAAGRSAFMGRGAFPYLQPAPMETRSPCPATSAIFSMLTILVLAHPRTQQEMAWTCELPVRFAAQL